MLEKPGAEERPTICAVASPAGTGERAVLRLSGPRTRGLLLSCCDSTDGGELALGGREHLEVRFDDGRGGLPARLLWMPGPRSFTREDVGELHLPGHPALVAAALERLLALGAEPAGPGEFTRRAFENGRIDLTRAEGILALVHARGRDERRAATALLAGGLDERLAGLREGMEDLRALSEASLDFDETDTGHVPTEDLESRRSSLEQGVREALGWESRRVPTGGEPRIVLVGEPNAGKSSLWNALTDEEQAVHSIVSDHAGTTRDSRDGALLVAGVRCRIVDTAGLDPTAVGVDAVAQSRAAHERRGADLELHVTDAAGGSVPPDGQDELPRVVVWNKCDLPEARPAPRGAVAVSAVTGEGLGELMGGLATALGLVQTPGGGMRPAGGRPGLGRELQARHREALDSAASELSQAGEGLAAGLPLDLFAEHLRAATASLDRITGRTTPEDLLGRIFARFCIGK